MESRLLLAAQIQGQFFEDLNGNGLQDGGEGGTAGWLAYVDLNEDGEFGESAVGFASTDVPKPVFIGSNTMSALDIQGQAATVDGLTVTLSIDHGLVSDLTVSLISPIGTRVELFSMVGSGQNFTDTVLDDDAATAIEDGQSPFTGAFRPEGSLSDFDGESLNGQWTLEVIDNLGPFDGDLLSWSMNVAGSQLEPHGVTDAGGNYTIDGLEAGDYTVDFVKPTGWSQTAPVSTTGGANVLPDGSFESGSPNVEWAENSSIFGSPLCTVDFCVDNNPDFIPRTGSWWVWFGGVDPGSVLNPDTGMPFTREDGLVSQSISIPVGQAELEFWLRIPTASGRGDDFVEAWVDGDVVFRATDADEASFQDYTRVNVDVSQYADGLNHLVTFRSSVFPTGDPDIVTNFFLDDVSLVTSVASGDPTNHQVTLIQDQVLTDVDFGNRRDVTGAIQGNVWLDADANGTNNGESGLAGRTVFIDSNFNGIRDQQQLYTFSETGEIPASESIEYPVVVSGLDLTVIDVDVLMLIDHATVEDLELTLRSPTGIEVPLVSGAATGTDFRLTTLDDEAVGPIADGTAPYQGRFQPEGDLSALDGGKAAGVWTLSITNHSASAGDMRGWALVLETGQEETSAMSDAAGDYSFTGLLPDEYTVIVEPGGYQQSFPVSEGEELIMDGSFEERDDSWNTFSLRFGSPLCDEAQCADVGGGTGPHSGLYWMWFGGYRGVPGDPDQQIEESSIDQDVMIPESAGALTFWLEITAAAGTGEDTLSVLIDGEEVFSVTDADAAQYANYQPVTVDISDYADGMLHNVSFEAITFGNGEVTNFYVDDVSLTDGEAFPVNWNVELETGEVASGIDFGLVENLEEIPPTVTSFEINAGLVDPPDLPNKGTQESSWRQQRSMIRTLVITFDEPVVVEAEDLVLTNLGRNAPVEEDTVVPLNDLQLSMDGNVLTITFAHGDLPDGVYRLEILDTVEDLAGNPLDGDGDGTGGDSYIITGNDQNDFYVQTADFNGDLGTSLFDFNAFAYWFAEATVNDGGRAPEYMDLNDDLGVSIFDFNAFASAFGTGITFPVGFAGGSSANERPEAAAERSASVDRALAEMARERPPLPSPALGSFERRFEREVDDLVRDEARDVLAELSSGSDLESVLESIV